MEKIQEIKDNTNIPISFLDDLEDVLSKTLLKIEELRISRDNWRAKCQ